jgi:hypothetical protein
MFVRLIDRFGLGARLTSTALVLGLLAPLLGCDGATDSPASDVTSADGWLPRASATTGIVRSS